MDLAIAASDEKLSRRKAKQIIDMGGTYVNKKRVRIASRVVEEGDLVEFNYDAKAFSQAHLDVPLTQDDILYDDEDVVVINKPPNLLTQATRSQAVYHVTSALDKLTGQKRNWLLVHRLDQETSGVLLVAKNKKSCAFLTEEIKSRSMEKEYLALCHGVPAWKEHTEECNLSAISPAGTVRVLARGGKHSLTHFKVLGVNKKLGVSLILCKPVTGRSHQLRVHLAKNNLGILGDKKYGDKKANLPNEVTELTAKHHLLHAYKVGIRLSEDGKVSRLKAAPPPNFQALMDICGFSLI